jgi:hypothetical protein
MSEGGIVEQEGRGLGQQREGNGRAMLALVGVPIAVHNGRKEPLIGS